jgi:hypothetical protein
MLLPNASYAESYKCSAEFIAQRTRKKLGVNVPEGKKGQYIEFGDSCGECFAKGRKGAIEGGGWRIIDESNKSCDKQ